MGSNVKVILDSDVHYGVIRWIGTPPSLTPGKLMAGVELVRAMGKNIQMESEVRSAKGLFVLFLG